VLVEQLHDPTATSEADINMQAFLARTLRLLDSTEIVMPALIEAMQSDHDRDVRRNAVASVAVIAGRFAEQRRHFKDEATLAAVIEMTSDSDPVLRALGAYALGLIPGEESRHRLSLLTGDAFDRNTRVNAAIGLARQHDPGGYEVFCVILSEPESEQVARPVEPSDADGPSPFEHHLAVKNVLKAVGDLAAKFSPEQSAKLAKLVKSVSNQSSLAAIRMEAKKTLNRLGKR
jgi:HEAT repeat protein